MRRRKNFFVFRAFITDSIPLWPPEFLSKETFTLPNGISRSSWMTISMEYGIWDMEHIFFTASPDLLTYVWGFARITDVLSSFAFVIRELDFLSNSQIDLLLVVLANPPSPRLRRAR